MIKRRRANRLQEEGSQIADQKIFISHDAGKGLGQFQKWRETYIRALSPEQTEVERATL